MKDTKEHLSVIESLGSYVPKKIISSKSLSKRLENNTLWKEGPIPLEKITGITNRHVVSNNETSYELAKKAIQNCLDVSRFAPKDIDIVISCNISKVDHDNQYQLAPSYAIQLKNDFGFANAIAFDLNNACAGTFTGISILDSFIKSGTFNNGLIVSGEYISHLTETALKEIESQNDNRLACLTLGDAGVACILERSESDSEGFTDHNIFTEKGSQHCIAKPTDEKHGGAIMNTNSKDLFIKSGFNSGLSTAHLFKNNNISFAKDINHVIMHQVSQRGYQTYLDGVNHYSDKFKVTDDIMIKNVHDYGNTASTSHLLAFDTYLKNGIIKENQTILFAILASGTTNGSFLYKMKSNPALRINKPYENASVNQVEVKDHSKIKIKQIGISRNLKGIKQTMQAINRSMKNSHKSRINSLIYTGMLKPDYICEPAYGTIISEAAELNKGVDFFSFDITNFGLGWLNACIILNNRPKKPNLDLSLIVSSETKNTIRFKGTETKLIESSTSTLISKSNDNSGFSHFTFYDYLEFIEDYKLDIMCHGEEKHFSCKTKEDYLIHLTKCINESVKKFMQLHNMNLADFNHILVPQISKSFLYNLSKSLNSDNIIKLDIDGDFVSSDIPYGLKHLLQIATKNDNALIISFSPGIQIGMAIYTF